MAIYESGEDYLETILLLDRKTGFVRAVDVAAELGFSKPSISRAMSILKKNGFVIVDPNGQIRLTRTGMKKATEVYERHTVIMDFLHSILGVNETTASQDACKIEHIISDESYLRLKTFAQECKEKDSKK